MNRFRVSLETIHGTIRYDRIGYDSLWLNHMLMAFRFPIYFHPEQHFLFLYCENIINGFLFEFFTMPFLFWFSFIFSLSLCVALFSICWLCSNIFTILLRHSIYEITWWISAQNANRILKMEYFSFFGALLDMANVSWEKWCNQIRT